MLLMKLEHSTLWTVYSPVELILAVISTFASHLWLLWLLTPTGRLLYPTSTYSESFVELRNCYCTFWIHLFSSARNMTQSHGSEWSLWTWFPPPNPIMAYLTHHRPGPWALKRSTRFQLYLDLRPSWPDQHSMPTIGTVCLWLCRHH